VSSVKIVAHRFGPQYLHSTAELLVERIHQSFALETTNFHHGGKIDVDNLVERVHARVGATGAHDEWLVVQTKRLGQRYTQQPHDRVVLGLVGKAAEGLTVIGEVEPPPLGGA
jgi:hypothetical protein